MLVKCIDFRSDTVTKPSLEMKKAMELAEVGDDVYGEDPSINNLENLAADIAGKEAALFTPSGTQANLIALLTHCQRGEEYIAGSGAHIVQWEAGGASVLGGIVSYPISLEENGCLDLGKVVNAIKTNDVHFPMTKLICIENTHCGMALPLDYIDDIHLFRKNQPMLNFHLDGARIFNASIFHNVSVQILAQL